VLCGLRPISHRTLSGFRSDHKEALENLFVQVVGMLSAEGLITMQRVPQIPPLFSRKRIVPEKVRVIPITVKRLGRVEHYLISEFCVRCWGGAFESALGQGSSL
jgi:hypothetical protein